jgi:DNA-binding MarR family transcriptional regulator
VLVSNSKQEQEDNFAPALAAAGRALIATMMAKVASYGFNDVTPAFSSLMPLLDATGARPSTLAQRAGITKQAISQLVRELETRGYVEQVPDSTDTRAKIVRLTKRGLALHAAAAEVRLELQSVALAKLGKSRVARLRRDLLELAAALEEMRTR